MSSSRGIATELQSLEIICGAPMAVTNSNIASWPSTCAAPRARLPNRYRAVGEHFVGGFEGARADAPNGAWCAHSRTATRSSSVTEK
jgi:hypothetical protein